MTTATVHEKTAAANPLHNTGAAPGNSLPRTRDVMDGGALEPLFSFKRFPVFLGCVETPPAQDLFADLSFAIGRHSGCVQLDQLVPLDVLYAANHATVVGELWERHHREFAEFVAELRPQRVLEIGGAHGQLCKNVQALRPAVGWTIIEPNPIPVPGLNAGYIRAFFDASFDVQQHGQNGEQGYDLVVHSHTLEHSYDPRQFMADIARILKPGDVHAFSVPNISTWLQRHYTNALNFEHTYLLCDAYVERLLAEHGFRLLQRRDFGDQHSVFYAAQKLAQPLAVPSWDSSLYDTHKEMMLRYRAHLLGEVALLNAQLASRAATGGGPAYLFGAHVFSQTLIALGLDTTRITCLLDNSLAKEGKRLYGTGLRVQHPECLRGETSPLVIIRAGAYEAEIKAGILGGVNPGTVFI
jgi:2-polyprenyl-3-methyl-5-hydroxy-6-metoxy-1,4-benzoquinol methylase